MKRPFTDLGQFESYAYRRDVFNAPTFALSLFLLTPADFWMSPSVVRAKKTAAPWCILMVVAVGVQRISRAGSSREEEEDDNEDVWPLSIGWDFDIPAAKRGEIVESRTREQIANLLLRLRLLQLPLSDNFGDYSGGMERRMRSTRPCRKYKKPQLAKSRLFLIIVPIVHLQF